MPLPTKANRSTFAQETKWQTYGVRQSVLRKLDPEERKKVRALFDFWVFIDLLEFQGGKTNFARIHKEMIDFVAHPQLTQSSLKSRRARRMMLVPRGHLKSTLCSIAYVLWRVYRNPDIRICVGTATRDLSLQFVRAIKQYLESDYLQDKVWNARPHIPGRLIPILDKAGNSRRNQRWDLGDWTEAQDKKVIWRQDALQVNRSVIAKEPTVLATSQGSNITGMHFDLIVLDDIVNDDNTSTPQKIDKTLLWTQDLESVVDPPRKLHHGIVGNDKLSEIVGDEMVVLGTRYALTDYYAYIKQNQSQLGYHIFERNIYVNGKDDSDGYIWAEKFTKNHVENIRQRQGRIRFSSQYLNEVVSSEEVIFDWDNLQYYDYHDISRTTNNKFRVVRKDENDKDVQHDLRPYLVVDPAISQKKGANLSCVLVGAISQTRDMYLLDYKHGHYLPEKLVEIIYELADKWSVNMVTVEAIAYQKALVYAIRQRFIDYRPLAVKEFIPRGEKKGRIETDIHPLLYNRKIWLSRWMAGDRELKTQLQYFPSETVRDDILDTMSMLFEVANPTSQQQKKTKYALNANTYVVNAWYGGRG